MTDFLVPLLNISCQNPRDLFHWGLTLFSLHLEIKKKVTNYVIYIYIHIYIYILNAQMKQARSEFCSHNLKTGFPIIVLKPYLKGRLFGTIKILLSAGLKSG